MAKAKSKKLKNYSKLKEQFIEWLTLDRFERIPANQGLLAKEFGVAEETLSRWKREPYVHAQVKERILSELGGNRGRIYGALIREAEKGSYHHIKLALEILRDIEKDNQATWKVEIINLVVSGQITVDQVEEEFGSDLVNELFNTSGAVAG